MKKNIKKKKGFTLIELMIVISIMVVIAAIAVPKYASVQKNAKINADIATAKTIADAVSVLVSQEKISETIGTATVPVAITASGTVDTAAVTDTEAVALIGRYLQSIPTSAVYKGENFKVSVADGIATVYVNSGVKDGKDVEVYPSLDAGYGK